MQKHLQKLLLLLAFLVPWVANAQTLTVANGTATNTYVPIYGFYLDADQHNQVVYPSSMLTDISGGLITSLTFYQSQTPTESWGTTVTIKLKEITDSTLTDLVSSSGATTVWTGTVNGTTATQVFNFTNPYVYGGGNLLVDITTTEATYSENYWYGISRSNSSVWAYSYDGTPSSVYSGDDGDVESFLPKTTFGYTTGSFCMPPRNFAASVMGDTVSFTWFDTSNASWQLVWGETGFNPDTVIYNVVNPYTTSYELTGMADGFYEAYIQAICTDDSSFWIGPLNFNIGIVVMNMATSGSDTLRTCNATIYDDGGPTGSYSNSIGSSILVVYPADNLHALSISGNSYTESTYDYLRIYSGVGTSGETLFDDYGVSAHQNFGPFYSTVPVTISFHTDGSVTYDGFEINISCIDMPDCQMPETFVSSSVGPYSADFHWTDDLASSWTIAYGPSGFTLGGPSTNYIDFYDTMGTVTGLLSNTLYDFYLMAVCGGDSSWTRMLTLRTTCTAIDSLPYVQTFESESTGSSTTGSAFVNCWTLLNNGTSYGGYPYVSSSSTYNHTPGGSKGLYWYNTTTTGSYGDYQCVILPGIDTDAYPINTLQLSFWAKSSSTSYYPVFYVGVMTNPNDINSFTPVDTINVGNSTNFAEFTTGFGGYAGFGNFIAVKAVRPTSSWYAYVDDFRLEVQPDCSRPLDLTVVTTTFDTVTVAWNDTNANNSAWQLAFGPTGFNPDTAVANLEDVTDTFYSFTNLIPGIIYDIYVRTDCYGEYSLWQGPVTVSPGAVNMPANGSMSISMCGGVVYDHGGPMGNYDNNVNGSITIYPSSNDSLVRVQGTFAGEGCCDYLGIYDGVGTSGTQFWYGCCSSSGTTMNLGPFTSFSGPITITFSSDVSGVYPGFAFSVSCIAAPECTDLASLSVQSVGTTSAYVKWTPLPNTTFGAPTGYELNCVDSSGATVFTTTTSDLHYLITALTPGESYQVSVRTVCDGGGNGNWESVSFNTSPMPCLEWDTASSGPVETYMVGTLGTSTTNVMPTNGGYNYAYCNHLIRTSDITVTGPITVGGIDLRFSGSSPMTNKTNCTIYMCHTTLTSCTDFANPADLVLVYEGPLNCSPTSDGWNHFDFNRGTFAYNGTSNMMVAIVDNSGSTDANATFYYENIGSAISHRVYRNDAPYTFADLGTVTAANSVWRTNMRLTSGGGECITASPCAAPHTVIDSLGSNAVHFVWAPGGNETSWLIEYKLSSDANWTVVGTSTTFSHTLTGLSPNTEYSLRLTSQCTDSNFSSTVTFRTSCGLIDALPWDDNLESYSTSSSTTGSAFITCWRRLNNGSSYGGYPYVSSSSSYNHTPGGTKGLYWYNTTTTGTYGDYQCVVLPGIDTTVYPMNTVQLSFWVTPSSSSYTPTFQIGVLSDPTDITTFQGVDTITLTSAVWTEIEVPFSRYTGNGMYPAVKAVRPTSSWYAYVDDFHLEEIPSCARPNNLHSTANTATSVSLDWTERNTAMEWEIAIETSATATPTADTLVYNHPTTITGLIGGTNYYFYVRSICGAGDTSLWSDVFMAVPGSWNMRPNQTDTLHMCGGVIYDEGGPSGAYYTPSQNSYVIIMPDAPNNLVSVSGNSYTESSFDYIRIYDGIGTSGTELWNDYGVSSNQTFGPLVSTSGPLTVYFHTDGSVYYDGFAINVSCIATTCRIFGLRLNPAVAASDSRLDITWDTNGALYYEVEYGLHGFAQGTGTLLTTYTNTATLTGLSSLTNYDVYVRSICPNTPVPDTGSWVSATFQTAMCDNAGVAQNWSSTSSSNTTSYGPIGYSCYNYSYSQMIIDSAQLASINGDITHFSFKPSNSASDYGSYFTGIDIYMANIPESTFSNDVIRPDATHQFVQVLNNANLNFTNDDWQIVALDTSFAWDGHSNILFVSNRRHGVYSCSAYFEAHNTSGYKSAVIYNDDSAFLHFSTLSTATTNAYSYFEEVVGDLKFYSCGASGCRQPVITGTSHTYESVTANWTGDGSAYEVNIKETTASDFTNADIPVVGTSYTFYGLQPATSYTVRVRQDCTADSLDYSDWVTTIVVTDSLPCLPPDSLTVTDMTNATATFNWVPFGYETMWDVHVWNTAGFDSTYTVSSHPVILGGYTAGVSYNASVRPLCGSAHNILGDWGDTVTFTAATCPDVTGLSAGNVQPNSLTLSWNNNPAADTWVIEYGYTGFEQGTGTQAIATTTTYVVTGLLEETGYDFYVRAMCGTDWYSENWAYVSATTPYGGVICDAPTGVSAVVAANAATVSWTPGEGNISYELEYGTHGFAHGTGTTQTATSSPITISNLNYETQYDVYVRAFCENNASSAWSLVTSFTTEAQGSEDCDPVTNLTATEVTENSAVVSWTAGATGSEWEVVLTNASGATLSEARTHEQRYQLNGLTPGTSYVVKVRTVCGDDQYSGFVSTSFTTIAVGIDRVTEATCTIYPNPTSSATTISVSGVSGKVKIAVVDMNGRTVASELLECSSDCTKTMDVERLAQGAYFVRITGENVSMVKKLIVR